LLNVAVSGFPMIPCAAAFFVRFTQSSTLKVVVLSKAAASAALPYWLVPFRVAAFSASPASAPVPPSVGEPVHVPVKPPIAEANEVPEVSPNRQWAEAPSVLTVAAYDG